MNVDLEYRAELEKIADEKGLEYLYDMAKEIDKNNKDVLDVLQANGVNVQSPLSVIDEAQADMVRRAYAPKPEKTEAPAEEKKEEQAVPKKRITAVFRSQNSSQAGRSKGPRPAVPGANF